MNGHTNNRVLKAHLLESYLEAKAQLQRAHGLTLELKAFHEGKMDQAVKTAFMFGLIQNRAEFSEYKP